jgi:hypothetical protein
MENKHNDFLMGMMIEADILEVLISPVKIPLDSLE